jgi:hypothetical protein
VTSTESNALELLKQGLRDRDQYYRDLLAMTERNTELAKRVSELEIGLLDVCMLIDRQIDDPRLIELRKLASGT